MSKRIIICFILVGFFLNINVGFAREPANLDVIKSSLMKYHDSGEYQKDQAKVIDQAMQYLKTQLEKEQRIKSGKKFAIVLDIDETSLSNYPDMVRMRFGGSLSQMIAAEDQGADPVIKPTLKLYRYAKANHVAVFFITGRTERERAATEKNLINAGFQHWDGLIMKPDGYQPKSAAFYKTDARSNIEKQGYTIVLNIGDQQSDLLGGYAEKTFKLPNPYYLIP
ncbi:MAG: acid phosphatase [uncultured bacterium]|nr:MAG: acid phosphatase [uncultured bacterium]